MCTHEKAEFSPPVAMGACSYFITFLRIILCVNFFGQNLAKHKLIYSYLEIFRHYRIIVHACSTVAIMAHIPLLIATVNRDVSLAVVAHNPLPPPPRTQNSNVPLLSINSWKLLESLDAVLVLKNTLFFMIIASIMYGSGN